MTGTAARLMDLAEARMREGGYHGFSFRDLATAAGIKSASVHHHFPTKPEMVIALLDRSIDRFAQLVAPTAGETPDDVIASYRAAFRSGLCENGGMCMFGLLGAESGGLPPEVVGRIELFFRKAEADLEARIGGPDAGARALSLLATLEGGLILARAFNDPAAFDQATSELAA